MSEGRINECGHEGLKGTQRGEPTKYLHSRYTAASSPRFGQRQAAWQARAVSSYRRKTHSRGKSVLRCSGSMQKFRRTRHTSPESKSQGILCRFCYCRAACKSISAHARHTSKHGPDRDDILFARSSPRKMIATAPLAPMTAISADGHA